MAIGNLRQRVAGLAAEAADREPVDEQPTEATPDAPPRRGVRWAEIKRRIYARAKDPWVSIRVGDVELVSVRIGSYISMIAPEGCGKSSLALQTLTQHARDIGPAVYVTPELDADEAGGRVIGQDRDATWPEVLKGQVPFDEVVDHARFVVLEREDATLPRLEEEVVALAAEYPGQPILVAWDYLQASPGDDGEERMRIARLSSGLRRLTKRLGLVLMAVSQGSRGSAGKLARGELLGTEASRTGAESAQIERDSYVIMSLGDRRRRDDGTEAMSVSIGKFRMGVQDVVYDAIYTGRSGRWRIVSEAQPADEVRTARDKERTKRDLTAMEQQILGICAQATAPLARGAIEKATGKAKAARAALAGMLSRRDVVEVDQRQAKTSYYLIWTAAQAAAAGIALRSEVDP